ncbi:bifunctional biotin--[acetyl-CoA-carboxylase] ligase/biotin operon repressor BirA [Teredinibacter sp. KSP-S5-2]|uniref:bifunctional biotin--[acetyl-CoA-carboxylase] ligase/biotin operon repressor BirA n=1 Tax=Teredinibacter sp. KSP-S5-2 TaxID=3034506 RepID=UPI002934E661|nr:bifunctional biotin--[acetyl-CoA-carboxylase] ligase/biotin operon repressor BirA [Teredinibacter sp. KSP-S5-2]WNO09686.1 bifunctional biotin--[acetyl-CoA-carboxylase] ligase/biotin operon repressor BirA [Teredinibacter sp. KSP-S5-2]
MSTKINSSQIALLNILADGEYHSGEGLGAALSVSRAAVWKNLQALADFGISVQSHKGLGYRIEGGLDLIDMSAVLADIDPEYQVLLEGSVIEPVLDSTNSYLMDFIASNKPEKGKLCIAEYQSSGRGRRGRVWQSPYASNIYMSLGWRFQQGVAALEGLSLAVGVAICEALEALGVDGVALKWPNDVLYHNKKLAGILLEMSGDASGECYVVVGVGLNVKMTDDQALQIDQPWVDLDTIICEQGLAARGRGLRGRVVSLLLNRLLPLLDSYESAGFVAYRDAWESRHAYRAAPVKLITPSGEVDGLALGVTDTGGLRLSTEQGEKVFIGGEVSLRGVV